jgi:hypothetical protein
LSRNRAAGGRFSCAVGVLVVPQQPPPGFSLPWISQSALSCAAAAVRIFVPLLFFRFCLLGGSAPLCGCVSAAPGIFPAAAGPVSIHCRARVGGCRSSRKCAAVRRSDSSICRRRGSWFSSVLNLACLVFGAVFPVRLSSSSSRCWLPPCPNLLLTKCSAFCLRIVRGCACRSDP